MMNNTSESRFLVSKKIHYIEQAIADIRYEFRESFLDRNRIQALAYSCLALCHNWKSLTHLLKTMPFETEWSNNVDDLKSIARVTATLFEKIVDDTANVNLYPYVKAHLAKACTDISLTIVWFEDFSNKVA